MMPHVSGRAIPGHPGIYPYEVKRAIPSKRQRYEARAMQAGVQHTKRGFTTMKAAEEWKQAEEVAMRGGGTTRPASAPMTLGQYIDARWLPMVKATAKTQRTASIYENHAKHIKLRVGDLVLANITTEDIDDFKIAIATDGMGKHTQHDVFERLRMIMKFAVNRRVIPFDPTQAVKTPRKPDAREPDLSLAQIERLLSEAEGSWYGALVFFVVMTGLRFGEATRLTWAEVDFGEAVIYTGTAMDRAPSERPAVKTQRSRRALALGPATLERLQRHRYEQMQHFTALGGPAPQLVFTSVLGRPIKEDNLRMTFWNPFVERLGLPWLHFHDLRHVNATLLAKAGTDPLVRQKRMGHTSQKMTNLYTHLGLDQQREPAAAVEGLLGLRAHLADT